VSERAPNGQGFQVADVQTGAGQVPLAGRQIVLPAGDEARARLHGIIRDRSFGRGKIILTSGRESDFYFNLKPAMCDPAGASLIAQLVLDVLRSHRIEAFGGLEMGAVPIAGAVAALSALVGEPVAGFFVRKKPKEHGAQALVEGLAPGESLAGRRVAVIEDTTTTGGSVLKAVEAMRGLGVEVCLVLTIVDRQEGAAEAFAAQGLPFVALFTADEFLNA
jgi:orotate phosphoribosyltransferase